MTDRDRVLVALVLIAERHRFRDQAVAVLRRKEGTVVRAGGSEALVTRIGSVHGEDAELVEWVRERLEEAGAR